MKYQEYLNQPGMMDRFNVKYNELKGYFQKRFEKLGISKEQNNLLASKVALLDADYLFSELYNNENKDNEKDKEEFNNN
jgi:hypothetical protein